jgi:hypothetical protein
MMNYYFAREQLSNNFKVISRYSPGRTEENNENPARIASFRAEILTGDLNAKQKC